MNAPASTPGDGWGRTLQCPTHGAYEDHGRYMRNPCPTCTRERQQAEREAARAHRQARRLRESGLRGRFLAATLDNFTADTAAQRQVLQACKDFAAGPLDAWRVLQLLGPAGTGKTHLAAAMTAAVIARDHDAYCLTAREIVRTLRATWGKQQRRAALPDHDDEDGGAAGDWRTEEGAIQGLADAGLLVVDELGVGFGTEAETVQLFDVINRRYELERPTVIASNLTAAELRRVVGDRLFDRLRESAQGLAMSWPSYRGRKT